MFGSVVLLVLISIAAANLFDCPEGPPGWAGKAWANYCNNVADPKVWSMPYDCSYYQWGSGTGANNAQDMCSQNSGKECHVYDSDGRKCFGCSDPASHYGSAWTTYCSKPQPKAFATTKDCSYYYYVWGSSTQVAVDVCENNSGKDCYAVDDNGEGCFSCYETFPTGESADWAKYCAAGSEKAFYMTPDCKSYGFSYNWGSLDVAHVRAFEYCQKNECQMWDDGGKTTGPICLPTCYQYESEWCWTATTAEIINFWAPEKYQAVGNDCHGLECKVASYHFGRDCCSDTTKRTSCSYPMSMNEIGRIAKDFVAQSVSRTMQYAVWSRRLSENEVQRWLLRGPMVVLVKWDSGGGHFITLGGSTGKGGIYFVHDPLYPSQTGKYQNLYYAQICRYREPEGRYFGTWSWTLATYAAGTEETMAGIKANSTIRLKHVHGHYLEANDTVMLAPKTSKSPEQHFILARFNEISIMSGDTVYLQTPGGKCIGADGSGKPGEVRVQTCHRSESQKIIIEKGNAGYVNCGDRVYLKIQHTGRYMDVRGTSVGAHDAAHAVVGKWFINNITFRKELHSTDVSTHQQFVIDCEEPTSMSATSNTEVMYI